MDSEIVSLMVQLKFHKTTSLLYELILNEGPLSLQDISIKLQQKATSLEDYIKQLLQLRLIGFDTFRLTKRLYYATNPSIAWITLVADLVWNEKVDLSPIDKLEETDNAEIENLRMICREVSLTADKLYRPHRSAIRHKERDAETLDEFVRLTCEIIYQARENIYALSKTPRLPSVSQFWAVLSDRMKKGIPYIRIVDLEEIVDHGLKTKERDIREYPIQLYVLEREKIRDKFYIVDGKLMAISHKLEEIEAGKKIGVGRVTNHYHIIERKKQQYERILKDAMPAQFVLDYMRIAAEKLLTSAIGVLSDEECNWLNDLIQLGRFSKYHKDMGWTDSKFERIKNHALETGFVTLNDFGDVIPVYRVSEAALRKAYRASTAI